FPGYWSIQNPVPATSTLPVTVQFMRDLICCPVSSWSNVSWNTSDGATATRDTSSSSVPPQSGVGSVSWNSRVSDVDAVTPMTRPIGVRSSWTVLGSWSTGDGSKVSSYRDPSWTWSALSAPPP